MGRVIAYLAGEINIQAIGTQGGSDRVVGYIENTVPVYSAEVAPAALRGFCAGLLTPVITMSSVYVPRYQDFPVGRQSCTSC